MNNSRRAGIKIPPWRTAEVRGDDEAALSGVSLNKCVA